ncbi:MAG TPA: hypothetical protein VJM75_01600 [Acidimicrobiales bacterium]|nr:hypothetical protein [Acidimicrobiales bacterium]
MISLAFAVEPGPLPLPRYEDCESHDAYLLAFHIARAQRQDGRLNTEELGAQWAVTEQHIRAWSQRQACDLHKRS